MKSILTTLAVVTALALGATGTFADDTRPGDAPPAPKMGKALTIEDLGAMLEAMGVSPKPLKTKDGTVFGYAIELEYGGWTIRMRAMLSDDRSNVLFNALFRTVDLKENVPGLVLAKLLQLSPQIWPGFIGAWEDGTVYVTLPVPNVDMTPAKLRKCVNRVADIVREIVPALDPTSWPKSGGPTPMPPAPAPAPKG